MNKLSLLLIVFSTIITFLSSNSQTLNWSGFPNGGTSYTTGIMTVTVTSSAPGFQNGTPKHYAGSTVGSGECGNTGGLALEHSFGNITTAHSLVTLDFTSGGTTSGLCGSISFQIKDINSEESSQTFADWVEVAATNGLNVAVPVANITATGGSNKTITANGNTRVVVGHSNAPYGSRASTACDNVTFTVTPATGTTLKTVTIKYHPEYTVAPNDYYNLLNPKRPSYQYISISPISVTAAAGPTNVQLTTTPASCSQNDGTVLIGTVIGGATPYQYNFNTLGLGTTSSFSNLAPGTYPVIVQDNNGCTLAANAVVASTSGPTAVASTITPASCGQNNGSISLGNVTGGTAPYQFNFNNLGLSTTTNFTNLAPGNYPLTVQDNAGCSYSTSLNVSGGSSPSSIVTTPSLASCGQSNGSVSLGNVTGGTAPFQYNFNNLGLSSSSNYTNLSAGDYPLIVQDNLGCSFSTTITISTTQAGPTAIQTTISNENCNQQNGSVSLGNVTGGNAPYNFDFNNLGFSSTQNFTNLSAGTYDLMVKDNNGCTFETTVIIGENQGPTAIAISASNEICGQGNAVVNLGTITGGIAPYQYNFNNLGYSSTFSYPNLNAGTYSLIVKDGNGCEYTTQVTIGLISGPTQANFIINQTTCNSNNGSIEILNVISGTAPYQYSLNGSNYTVIPNFPFLSAGLFSVSIKDANGCILDTSFTINPSAAGPEMVSLDYSSPSCGSLTGSLNNVILNLGTAPFNYALDNGVAQNSPVFTNISVGTHSILIIDNQGCGFSAYFEILPPITETELHIPNVFTPNSDAINPVWIVEGTCVEALECTIFNRWGNVMQTMKGTSVSWDGIAEDKAVNPGVYFYKLTAKFTTGTSQEYHGHITVIY